MKLLLTILLLLTGLISFSQQEKFLLEAKVVDQTDQPVSDVYIVNLVSQEKDISRANGVFSIWVLPSDSVVLSHISYFRKMVSVYSLLINPVVTLVAENVNISEVKVSPDQKTDYDRAMENISFLTTFDVPDFAKIKEENQPALQLMTEHNELMRSDAASVSLVRLSPAEQFGKFFKKLKKKERSKQYYSTKKKKKE
ncbi:MAG: hypothetical protein ABFS16_04290 [Bacteroidota bacterium]